MGTRAYSMECRAVSSSSSGGDGGGVHLQPQDVQRGRVGPEGAVVGHQRLVGRHAQPVATAEQGDVVIIAVGAPAEQRLLAGIADVGRTADKQGARVEPEAARADGAAADHVGQFAVVEPSRPGPGVELAACRDAHLQPKHVLHFELVRGGVADGAFDGLETGVVRQAVEVRGHLQADAREQGRGPAGQSRVWRQGGRRAAMEPPAWGSIITAGGLSYRKIVFGPRSARIASWQPR